MSIIVFQYHFFVDRINQYQINKQKEYKVIEFQKIFIDI